MKLFLFTILFSLSVFAGLSKAELINAIKGKYTISIPGDDVKGTFLIRSSGKLQILDIDDGAERVSDGSISYNFSDSDYAHTGMPVVHLTFLYGSDEDSYDYHILMTANKDGDTYELKKITAFQTFNDGPNDMADYFGKAKIVIKKYDKGSKRYKTIR